MCTFLEDSNKKLPNKNHSRFSQTQHFIYSDIINSTACFGPMGYHQVGKNGRQKHAAYLSSIFANLMMAHWAKTCC